MSFRNDKEILVYTEAIINVSQSGRLPVYFMCSKKLPLTLGCTNQTFHIEEHNYIHCSKLKNFRLQWKKVELYGEKYY